MNYRLLLVTNNKPETPEGIFSSAQMLGWGLWEEFSKLPHVTLTYQNAEEALKPHPVDFTLLHAYFQSSVFFHMEEVRAMTSRRIINFIELPLPNNVVDKNFTYINFSNWEREGLAPVEHIPFPCISELLKVDPNQEKWPKSVLLDHSWAEGDPNRLWCGKLYSWLEPFRDSRKVGQLRRTNVDIEPDVNWKLKSDPVIDSRSCKVYSGQTPVPDWVQSIPECSYPEYLKRTAPYENYILTHPESYGHSIIDMVARGIRVLVPENEKTPNVPFAPRSVIDQLKLPTFRTRDELLAILDSPPENNWRLDLLTDMPEVVRRIDSYCQNEMKKDA